MKNYLVPALSLAALVTVPGSAIARPDSFRNIVNVDLMPESKSAGSRLLIDFVRAVQKDPTVMGISLIQQSAASNHFIIDERFADKAAYERFSQTDYVRRFRAALYPHLGSPWDERLGTDLGIGQE